MITRANVADEAWNTSFRAKALAENKYFKVYQYNRQEPQEVDTGGGVVPVTQSYLS